MDFMDISEAIVRKLKGSALSLRSVEVWQGAGPMSLALESMPLGFPAALVAFEGSERTELMGDGARDERVLFRVIVADRALAPTVDGRLRNALSEVLSVLEGDDLGMLSEGLECSQIRTLESTRGIHVLDASFVSVFQS